MAHMMPELGERKVDVAEESNILTEMALRVPKTLADYDRLCCLLDVLIDEVGEDENHPLAEFMDKIGTLIKEYEDANIPELA